ncbi:MAG: hypothetical protein ACP5NV_06700 [Candidatus Woesearchaeota archaeon]
MLKQEIRKNRSNKKRTDYRKAFALTAIYLMISLTFLTANALATFEYTISGENLVNGWRKSDDITVFNVDAQANVSIQKTNGNWQPMICEENSNNSYHCEYFFARSTTTLNEMTFILRHEINEPEEYTALLKVDRTPPRIDMLNITNIAGGVKVDYSIRDTAYFGTTECSGLDYISYIIGSENGDVTFNTTRCSYTGTISFNESGFYQDDFIITIIASDKLGQQITNTTTIVVDTKGPEIQENFQIIKNGNILEILSKKTDLIADIAVYVDDPMLDVMRITGDLSELNPNPAIKPLLKNKQSTCTKESGSLYKCTFSAIPIRPVSETLKINITAYDKSGNNAITQLTKTVTLLSDPGTPTYIGPLKNHCNSDLSICYTSKGTNTYILEINSGSNYSIISYGLDDARTPGLCRYEENKWVCYAPFNQQKQSGQLKVHVAYPSTDIYGNEIPYIERMLTIDSGNPSITSSNITSNLPNCAVSSDTLELSFTAQDAISDELKTYVNTSGFTNNEMSNGTCENINNEWHCKISITGFVTTYTKTTRDIYVEDLAGNTAKKSYTFEVCEENAQAVPNVITKIETDKKPLVDRRTASIVSVKNYVPLKITHTGTIIEMNVESCTAKNDDGAELMNTGNYIMNNILVLYIGAGPNTYIPDTYEINCTISARVRTGNRVYEKLELENIVISGRATSNTLGTIDSGVQKKINEQKAALRELDSTMQTYISFEKTIGTLCDLVNILVKINSLVQTIKSALYGICLALESFWGIGEGIWTTLAPPMNWMDKMVQQYLWPTGINLDNWIGYIVKYTCMLYTCQHYKVSGLYSMTVDAIGIGNAISERNKLNKELQDSLKPTDEELKELEKNKQYMDEESKKLFEKMKQDLIKKQADEIQLVDNTPETKESKTETIPKTGEEKKEENVKKEPVQVNTPLSEQDFFKKRDGSLTLNNYVAPIDKTYVAPGKISRITIVPFDNNFFERKTGSLRLTDYVTPIDKTYVAPSATVKVIQDITGRATDNTGIRLPDYSFGEGDVSVNTGSTSSSSSSMWDTISAQDDAYLARNMKFYSDLESNDWIINPYKSVHYDHLCLPAILYNKQKEKQLRCKYLSCLESQNSAGLPSYVCDRDYGMEYCLYIDSAQYKFDDGANIIITGLLRSALVFATGVGVQAAYSGLCSDYIANIGIDISLASGSHDVACGLGGALLQWKETTQVFSGEAWEGFLSPNSPNDPSEIYDYCNGVDYSE